MTNFEPQYPRGRSGELPDQPSASAQAHPPRPHNTQQPDYAQPPYGPPRGTNVMAVLAIIFAFVFSPLGVVFGVIARNQIRNTGEEGDGLALAGIILGAVFTVLFVLYVVLAVIAIIGVGDLFETIPDQQ